MIILIDNDGPLITSSNFWESEMAGLGLAYLSINSRAFRLLVPIAMEPQLPEMATGKLVIVSRPRNPSRYGMEILFEDGTQSPFCLYLDEKQIMTLPTKEDDGRTDLEFTVWTRPRNGVPHQALRRPAAYRVVPRIPWMKPWSEAG